MDAVAGWSDTTTLAHLAGQTGSALGASGGDKTTFLLELAVLVGDAEVSESSDGEGDTDTQNSEHRSFEATDAPLLTFARVPTADPNSSRRTSSTTDVPEMTPTVRRPIPLQPAPQQLQAESKMIAQREIEAPESDATAQLKTERGARAITSSPPSVDAARQREQIPVAFAARLNGPTPKTVAHGVTSPTESAVTVKGSVTEVKPPAPQPSSPPAESAQDPNSSVQLPTKKNAQPEAGEVRTSPTAGSSAPIRTRDSEPVREAGATPRTQIYETQRAPDSENVVRSAGSATRIDLKVGSRPNDGANLQVVERGGKVHVAVRTPDTQLANSLQDGLPRLVTQLENRGFRTETWTPGEAVSAGTASREIATSVSDNTGDPGNDRDFRGSQQDQQHQGRRRQDQPAWMEEFERNLSEDTKEDTKWTQLLRR